MGFKEYWYRYEGGAIPQITVDQVLNNVLVLPPLSEQEAISGYLDKQTGKIDKSIESLEQQKADLQQYRTSVISEAVTRGLTPNAPLKDSGVQWIGQIPAGWNAVKLGWLFETIGSGTTPQSGNSLYYADDGDYWLQTGDLNDGLITDTNKRITKNAYEEYSLRKYPIGAIVIAMYGATIGKLGILGIETATNQACCVMADSNSMLNKFAFYCLAAGKSELTNFANGGGQPNISQAIIKEFRIPVPPLSEQEAIAAYLDEQTGKIDTAIATIDQQIADLRAYRTALITEAVTGKVDVRVSV